jgi:hypothetical protein
MEQESLAPSTTPLARQIYDFASLTLSDKGRIKDADPNGGVCLVTNKLHGLNYCHCIPKQYMKNETIVCL